LEGKERTLGRKAATVVASLKGAGLVTLVDFVLGGLAVWTGVAGFVGVLGLALLIESAALMLVGGALSFSGQEGVRRLAALLSKTQTKATKAELQSIEARAGAYALMGVLLFAGSLALAAFTD
jgi:hypothetical protein